MNETIVETNDVEDKVQTVKIEESFEDMIEDNVETDIVKRVDREFKKLMQLNYLRLSKYQEQKLFKLGRCG